MSEKDPKKTTEPDPKEVSAGGAGSDQPSDTSGAGPDAANTETPSEVRPGFAVSAGFYLAAALLMARLARRVRTVSGTRSGT